jgi:hypothetical protein
VYNTDMNYALAKQLKDAGFPFIVMEREHQILHVSCVKLGDIWYLSPDLEKLIDACGDPVYLSCEIVEGRRICVAARELKPNGEWIKSCGGSTPIEAAARLWLALHAK